MIKHIPIVNERNVGVEIEGTSIECPYCHQTQIPEMYCAIKLKSFTHIIFCQCTNEKCRVAFNRLYDSNGKEFFAIAQGKLKSKGFNDEINSLSPSFVQIYNEAYSAEQMELSQITGVGYRKALEFLIKDYLISLHSEKEDSIKTKPLGRCISEDIDDARIKSVAERATWLGNDETHYVRKWENKDVSHLKTLIDLCLHWIEAEISTRKLLEDMPEGKK